MRIMRIVALIWMLASFWTMPALAQGATLNLQWDDQSTTETSFVIERCQGLSASCSTFAVLQSTAANVTTYADGNLSDGLSFCYRVKAVNSSGSSGYTNVACAITPMQAPSNLSLAQAPNNGGVTVIWKDNSANETGHEILRATTAAGPFTSIGTASANATSFTDTSAAAKTEGATLFYQVKASNAVANATSAAVSITIPLPSPTNLRITISMSGNVGKSRVVSTPSGIDCPPVSCAADFPIGTSVTLTPVPGPGRAFNGFFCSGIGRPCITGRATTYIASWR